MPGTSFSTSNWTGYDEQSVANPSSQLTDFPLLVDVSALSSTWKSNVQSDAGDIRITDGSDTELAYDLIQWEYNAGSPTGYIRFRDTVASSGTQNYRIWSGYTGGTAVEYDANETYGSDNAYPSSLLSYLPMHSFTDRTSNGADGAGSGGVVAGDSAGLWGDSTAFDGYDGEVDLGGSFGFDKDEGTVIAWCYSTTSSGVRTLFAARTDGSNEVEIVDFNGGPLYTRFKHAGGGVSNDVSSAASLPLNTWAHCAMVWSDTGDELRAYRDGSQIGATQTGIGTLSSTPPSVKFGRSGTLNEGFLGRIDQAMVFDAPLSGDWISHEYDQSNDQSSFWGTWAWNTPGGGGGSGGRRINGGLIGGGGSGLGSLINNGLIG